MTGPGKPRTLVVADNERIMQYWLEISDGDPGDYELVTDFRQITDRWGPIIVINGGSFDAHVQSLVRHPMRRALVTYIEV
jgi:uncharacterized membrane-anchored protein